MSERFKRLQESGLIGCLNDTGVDSQTYKRLFNAFVGFRHPQYIQEIHDLASASSLSLSHYSSEPLPDRLISKTKGNLGRHFNKPDGFWLSVDGEGDWKDWCIAEEFNLAGLQYRYSITLEPDCCVPVISNKEDLLKFTACYRSTFGNDQKCDWFRYIDWSNVSNDMQGIVISPFKYEWGWDTHLTWVYGWDCDSGCIWDVSAIKNIDLMEYDPTIGNVDT